MTINLLPVTCGVTVYSACLYFFLKDNVAPTVVLSIKDHVATLTTQASSTISSAVLQR